jgi:hypothetical protein
VAVWLTQDESMQTYEGPHDIHALVLGRAMIGISAFW